MATIASLVVPATRVCMEVLVTTISRAIRAMTISWVVQGTTLYVAAKAMTACGAMVMTIFSWEEQVTITLMAALAGMRSAAAALLLRSPNTTVLVLLRTVATALLP